MIGNITIGGWIYIGIIASCVVVVLVGVFLTAETKMVKMVATIVAVVVIVASVLTAGWYYTSTEAGKRAVKDQESNFQSGITRQVDVYDMEGDLIKTYKGKFDVEMSDTHILFDDENGKRHIVYFTTGTVILDEQ